MGDPNNTDLKIDFGRFVVLQNVCKNLLHVIADMQYVKGRVEAWGYRDPTPKALGLGFWL